MRMPFGKHRGEDLTDIPLQYLLWLEESATLSPELRGEINHEIGRRTGDRSSVGRTARKPGAEQAMADKTARSKPTMGFGGGNRP